MKEFYELDVRTANLSDEKVQLVMSAQFEEWIEASKNQMRRDNILEKYEKDAIYYEGKQSPIRNSGVKQWVDENWNKLDKNQFTVTKDDYDRIYYVDNKIGGIVDNMVGEYTSVKRRNVVKRDKKQGNDNIERIVSNTLEHYENKKQYWEKSTIPAIRHLVKYGEGFEEGEFDPFINIPLGDIKFTPVPPWEVLRDPRSMADYYTDAEYMIRMKNTEHNQFQQMAELYGAKDVPAIDEYNNWIPELFRRNMFGLDVNYTTSYNIYYKRTFVNKINIKEIYPQGEGEISGRYTYKFKARYVPTYGVISNEIIPYSNLADDEYGFLLFPFCGKKSDLRVEGVSMPEILSTVQDIMNITKSLILNNARQKDKARYFIKAQLFDKHKALFDAWWRYGGFLPLDDEDMRNAVVQFQQGEIPSEIYSFVQIADQSLKDLSVRYSALMGDYPSNELSGVAMDRMRNANRRSNNYNDIAINYANTLKAKFMYRVIAKEFTDNDFVELEGKGSIPISTMWTGMEFEAYLAENYPLMSAEEAFEKFTKENIVEFQYATTDENGMVKDEEEIKATSSVVFINYLTKPNGDEYDLDIRTALDWDSERNRMEDTVIASNLMQQGNFTLRHYLKMLGGYFEQNADEIVREVDERNQTMQMARMISEMGEEGQQMAMKSLQEIAQQILNK